MVCSSFSTGPGRRRGYAIELDPGRIDTAIAGWERMTKQTARHATGKTFEELRAERQGEGGGDDIREVGFQETFHHARRATRETPPAARRPPRKLARNHGTAAKPPRLRHHEQ